MDAWSTAMQLASIAFAAGSVRRAPIGLIAATPR
jgi:hypothetical protein